MSEKLLSGKIIRHINKFRHFCPVEQPKDASFLEFSSDKIFVTSEKLCDIVLSDEVYFIVICICT